jgi:hypothetical protein
MTGRAPAWAGPFPSGPGGQEAGLTQPDAGPWGNFCNETCVPAISC